MGFFSRIKEGLKKSGDRLTDGLKKLSEPSPSPSPPSPPSPSPSPPSPSPSPPSPSPSSNDIAPEPVAEPEPTPEPSPSPEPEPSPKPTAPEEKVSLREGEKKEKVGGWFLAKFGGKVISAAALQELEELLISADMGAALAGELCRALAADKPKLQSDEDLRRYLAEKITARLENYRGEHGDKNKGEGGEGGHGFPSVADIRAVKERGGVFTIFVMGANGCGKTTSIAKLAHYYSRGGEAQGGLKVLLVGGDLFRAAGSEQLAVWGERLGIDVMAAEQGGSSSGLVYEAHARALGKEQGEKRGEGYDLLIIDTAGRLHNKADLMAELGKLDRVIKKQDGEAPHAVVLVVDGTGGRHILDQAEAFNEVLPLTHVLMTKLDSTAKGGILLALVESLRLPVMAIGVGEAADDLLPFAARDFAYGLLGLEED